MKSVTIAQAKDQLPALVHEAEASGPIQLTRRGKPVAVLLSQDDFARRHDAPPNAWAALAEFRRAVDLTGVDVDAVFVGVRDQSPGPEAARW